MFSWLRGKNLVALRQLLHQSPLCAKNKSDLSIIYRYSANIFRKLSILTTEIVRVDVCAKLGDAKLRYLIDEINLDVDSILADNAKCQIS